MKDDQKINVGNLLKQANKLRSSGNLDEAITLYRQIIEIHPYFAWAYQNLGDVLAKQGNWEEAVDYYSQGLKFNPQSAWLLYSLGDALAQLGDLENAVKYLEKSFEIQPNYSQLGFKNTKFLKNKHEKIFCISFQRTGTTSVGRFFRDFGYRTVGWADDSRYEFSEAWHEGNYEYIFSHPVFLSGQVFEDSPWFL